MEKCLRTNESKCFNVSFGKNIFFFFFTLETNFNKFVYIISNIYSSRNEERKGVSNRWRRISFIERSKVRSVTPILGNPSSSSFKCLRIFYRGMSKRKANSNYAAYYNGDCFQNRRELGCQALLRLTLRPASIQVGSQSGCCGARVLSLPPWPASFLIRRFAEPPKNVISSRGGEGTMKFPSANHPSSSSSFFFVQFYFLPFFPERRNDPGKRGLHSLIE